MLREIERAVEALKAVPAEYHALVLAEARGAKKRGPKPGFKKRKKPGPKPGFKRAKKAESDKAPVKVDKAKLEKLAKLKAAQAG